MDDGTILLSDQCQLMITRTSADCQQLSMD